MPTISFDGLLIVAAAALAAPLVLGLFPRIRLPAIVLEIVLGIVIGPQVLGWVSIATPIQVMSRNRLIPAKSQANGLPQDPLKPAQGQDSSSLDGPTAHSHDLTP